MAPWKGALCTARPPRGSSPAPRPEDQTHTLLRAWSAGFSALTFWKRLKRSWLGYLCVAAHAAPPSGSPCPSAPPRQLFLFLLRHPARTVLPQKPAWGRRAGCVTCPSTSALRGLCDGACPNLGVFPSTCSLQAVSLSPLWPRPRAWHGILVHRYFCMK